jgi:hypothetical protein
VEDLLHGAEIGGGRHVDGTGVGKPVLIGVCEVGDECTPKVTAGSTPAMLGDLAVAASASASFTVSIMACNPLSQFTLSVPWSSAVYDTGTFVTNLNFNRGN